MRKKPILQLSDSINFGQIKSWTVCDTCPSQTGLLLSLNSSKFPFVITCDTQNTCLKRPVLVKFDIEKRAKIEPDKTCISFVFPLFFQTVADIHNLGMRKRL